MWMMWIPNGGRTNVTKMPPNKPHQFRHVVVSNGNKYYDASSQEYYICGYIWGYKMTACRLYKECRVHKLLYGSTRNSEKQCYSVSGKESAEI